MDFMGIGFFEMAVILLLILIFFGSKELPKFIRETARFVSKVRLYSDKVRRELDGISSTITAPASPSIEISTKEQKQRLREKFYEARRGLTPEDRKEKSLIIGRHLLDLPEFKNAGAVMMYVEMDSEVETRHLITRILGMGKRVVIPYCKPESGSMGIGEITDVDKDIVPGDNKSPEPRAELRDHFFRSDLQCIICPGVGFDIYGSRLGRGGAYYDNFLRELKNRVPIIALAFDCQVQSEQLPFSYSDVIMDQIITESGTKLPYSAEVLTATDDARLQDNHNGEG